MITTAFVFPGQGSQEVGMGEALAAASPTARAVFEEVDAALGQKLSALMWDGPIETLTLTENAQPALMAVSVAAVRSLAVDHGVPVSAAAWVAGHSLGEYSALAAAGAIELADAARLLRLRGQAMQRAAPLGAGAMASLIGKVDVALAEEIAAEGAKVAPVVVANDNNVGNVVISGAKAGVEAAIAAAKTRGVRAIPLNVSAPFHSPLMAPAAEEMRAALAGVRIGAPAPPLVANVTAAPAAEAETIRRLLVEQVTGRVRWRESIAWMATAGGVVRFVELGAGKVLAGMIRRIADGAEAVSAGDPETIAAAAAALRG